MSTRVSLPSGTLADYVEARLAEVDLIDADRRRILDQFALAIASALKQRGAVDLVFICSHNSRRSQFGQVWAKTAAGCFGLERVQAWSGGTEATALPSIIVEGLHSTTRSTIEASPCTSGPGLLVRTHTTRAERTSRPSA